VGLVWHGLVRLVAERWPLVRWAHPLVPLAAAGYVIFITLRANVIAPAPAAEGTPPGAHTLVLLTLDTFRADHLGALGGGSLTPNLDRLAHEGVLFTQAITSAPLTAPSHTSMLTGEDTHTHGVMRNGGRRQSPSVVSELHAAGYRTGAFVSAMVIERSVGLCEGFEHYDDRLSFWHRLSALPGWRPFAGLPPHERRGDATLERALDWLGESDRPTFLWLHLYDAHEPYAAPESFAPTAEEAASAREADAARRKARPIDFADVEVRKLAYRAEIRWTDSLVGRLVSALPKDARLIIAADHGESLDEHDYYFNHGATLWEESLHVPLVVHFPGEPPKRVDALAGLVQIAATLRYAAGLGPRQGSLLGVADGTTVTPPIIAYTPGQEVHAAETPQLPPGGPLRRALVAPRQSHAVAALRFDQQKLLAIPGSPLLYYSLENDPREADPLVVPEELTSQADALRQLAEKKPAPLSGEEREQLRALGYVE
jgi:arylsulfatase A-like enzyme